VTVERKRQHDPASASISVSAFASRYVVPPPFARQPCRPERNHSGLSAARARHAERTSFAVHYRRKLLSAEFPYFVGKRLLKNTIRLEALLPAHAGIFANKPQISEIAGFQAAFPPRPEGYSTPFLRRCKRKNISRGPGK
jgi:hypothetical protein